MLFHCSVGVLPLPLYLWSSSGRELLCISDDVYIISDSQPYGTIGLNLSMIYIIKHDWIGVYFWIQHETETLRNLHTTIELNNKINSFRYLK